MQTRALPPRLSLAAVLAAILLLAVRHPATAQVPKDPATCSGTAGSDDSSAPITRRSRLLGLGAKPVPPSLHARIKSTAASRILLRGLDAAAAGRQETERVADHVNVTVCGRVGDDRTTRRAVIATAARQEGGTGEGEEDVIPLEPLPPGSHFEVLTKISPPFVQIRDDGTTGPNGEPCYRGYSIDFLDQLSSRLGFSYAITHLSEETSANDVIDMIADPATAFNLGIAALTITSARAAKVDWTTPYYDIGLRVAVKPQQSDGTIWQFLIPFDAELWGSILAVLILIIISFWYFEGASGENVEDFGPVERWVDPSGETAVEGVDQAPRNELRFGAVVSKKLLGAPAKLSLAAYYMFGAIIGAYEARAVTPEGRVVVAAGLSFFFVLAATYTAELASFLTLSSLQERIFDVTGDSEVTEEDLGEFVSELAVPDGTSTQRWFVREIAVDQTDYVVCQNTQECLELVESGCVGGFISDEPLLDYNIRELGLGELALLGQPMNPQGYGIAFAPGTDETVHIFDRGVLDYRESSVASNISSFWFPGRRESNEFDEISSVGTEEVGGVFLLLGIGLTFAWCWYLARRSKKARYLINRGWDQYIMRKRVPATDNLATTSKNFNEAYGGSEIETDLESSTRSGGLRRRTTTKAPSLAFLDLPPEDRIQRQRNMLDQLLSDGTPPDSKVVEQLMLKTMLEQSIAADERQAASSSSDRSSDMDMSELARQLTEFHTPRERSDLYIPGRSERG